MGCPLVAATLVLTIHTAFCGSQSASRERPAADFALRFDHKGCHYEYLDTFKGTYSHVGPHPPVPFTLSDEQRHTLFAAVMAASFFDRPADLGTGKEPSGNYELEVRMPVDGTQSGGPWNPDGFNRRTAGRWGSCKTPFSRF
jgi:hypothetical protein